MTICALCRLVRPQQWKRGVRMIEAGQIVPRLGGVATFAPRCFTVRARCVEEQVESSLMRVGVTICAAASWPVVLRSRLRFEVVGRPMTVGAGDGKMASKQSERRFVVTGQAERGGSKPLKAVAIRAAVEVWRLGKLSRMFIGMAVGAELELDFEDREVALRNVALFATQCRVLAL